MADKEPLHLPDHLASLLHATPSGVAKLIAVWDGLNAESHILVLSKLDEAQFPAYWAEKIRVKALDSPNAYVRYLAARRFYFSSDDSEERKAIKQRIEEDSDPLVRYCLLERRWTSLGGDDADAFFALPQEARLAQVRSLEGCGERIAAVVSHGADHQLKEGKVSEIELWEILSDYLNSDEFRQYYDPHTMSSYDGLHEYTRGNDIETLWRLVLKLPEGVSHILIQHLPSEVGLSSGIPDEVVGGMTDSQIETLFGRNDIGYTELRKKIFFEADKKRDRARWAAILYNFDLTYAEFAAILGKSAEEKKETLRDLLYAHDLSPCFYAVIHDMTMADVIPFDALDAESARDALKRRLNQLRAVTSNREWQEHHFRELRLYCLAKKAVPWKKEEKGYGPYGKLEFLSNFVVENDTWATFMAFSKAWADSPFLAEKEIEKYLPRISEIGEDDAALDDESDARNVLEKQSIKTGFVIARIVAAGLLLLALAPNPQVYYMLLRFVVCGVAGFGAFLCQGQKRTGWLLTMGAIAILFNPFIPVWLNRDTWAIIDLATAALLLLSLWSLG